MKNWLIKYSVILSPFPGLLVWRMLLWWTLGELANLWAVLCIASALSLLAWCVWNKFVGREKRDSKEDLPARPSSSPPPPDPSEDDDPEGKSKKDLPSSPPSPSKGGGESGGKKPPSSELPSDNDNDSTGDNNDGEGDKDPNLDPYSITGRKDKLFTGFKYSVFNHLWTAIWFTLSLVLVLNFGGIWEEFNLFWIPPSPIGAFHDNLVWRFILLTVVGITSVSFVIAADRSYKRLTAKKLRHPDDEMEVIAEQYRRWALEQPTTYTATAIICIVVCLLPFVLIEGFAKYIVAVGFVPLAIREIWYKSLGNDPIPKEEIGVISVFDARVTAFHFLLKEGKHPAPPFCSYDSVNKQEWPNVQMEATVSAIKTSKMSELFSTAGKSTTTAEMEVVITFQYITCYPWWFYRIASGLNDSLIGLIKRIIREIALKYDPLEFIREGNEDEKGSEGFSKEIRSDIDLLKQAYRWGIQFLSMNIEGIRFASDEMRKMFSNVLKEKFESEGERVQVRNLAEYVRELAVSFFGKDHAESLSIKEVRELVMYSLIDREKIKDPSFLHLSGLDEKRGTGLENIVAIVSAVSKAVREEG